MEILQKGAIHLLPFILLTTCLLMDITSGSTKVKVHNLETTVKPWNIAQMEQNKNAPIFLQILRRMKREDDSTEDSPEKEDEHECRQLPPKPPRSKSSNVQIDLMELLNNGSHHMMENNEVTEAILILGNTGSGKTTLTQMIAGNLSRLHAVRTQSRRLVIVDDDDRIGAPSTISKTLVPELVLGENGTAFYDCPGFDDTRGAEEDIAANFFINQIITKVERVKLLFLVIHNSVSVGQERLDFDLMVSHATQFLRNTSNYNNSIGLVVTKVNSYDDGGGYIEDKPILKGIVQFLKIYRDNIRFQLQSKSLSSEESDESSLSMHSSTAASSNDNLERKVQFMETLLKKNAAGKYSKISFSRSPTACGPLSNSKVVSDTRNKLIQFYSHELEYAKVQPEDFGYTLKDKTKLAILNYVTSLNEDVTKGIVTIMNDFKKWFDTNYLENGELISKIEKLKRSAAELERLLVSWSHLGNTANPAVLLELVLSSLERLGFAIPIRDRQLIQQQQRYFDFFDELNSAYVSRAVRAWSNPVEKFLMGLKEDLDLAKGELRKLVSSLNQNISSEVSLLMDGFMDWFQEKGQNQTNLGVKLAEIQNVSLAFRELLSRLNVLGDRSYPLDFEAVLIPAISRLGFGASHDFQDYIRKSQDFFKLDDEINPPGVNRTVKDWMLHVTDLHTKLNELEEKVQLSLTIQRKGEEISRLIGELKVKEKLVKEKSRMVQRLFGELDRKTGLLKNAILLKDAVIQAKESNNKGLQDDVIELKKRNEVLHNENKNLQALIAEKGNKLAECEEKCLCNTDEQGNSKLHLAVKRRDEQAIQNLIRLGANVNAKNSYSETPLLLAATSKVDGETTIKIIKYLIKHGADVTDADMRGNTWLHQILSVESSLSPSQFHDITAYLVSTRMTNVFNLPEINFGRTPLMLAASNVEFNVTTLSMLLENGVNGKLTDKQGQTFLIYAANGNKNGNLLRALAIDGSSRPTLWQAIGDKNEMLVKVLVWVGADVNGKNNRSEAPLHLVAKTGDGEFAMKTINFLIDSGANVYNKDIDGNTFLHKLVGKDTSINSAEFDGIVAFLISMDLSRLFNTRNGPGETPFQYAVKNTEIRTTTLSLLKNNGVDFNTVDSEGKSVLYYATLGNGTLKLISDLVDLGSDEKHLTNHNNSLLHAAARVGRVDFVKYFLDKGLNVNANGQLGQTPLDFAFRYHQNSNVVQLLLKNGAKVYVYRSINEGTL